MNIENEVFKKQKLIESKLLPYGFFKKDNKYKLVKKFMNNEFEAIVCIDSDEKISGKVIDLEFGDEYTNIYNENVEGQFVNSIRNEYIKILNDIAQNCFEKKYFIFEQSNRITNYIYKKYSVKPEFPWDKYEGDGIFREENSKWFGIIMNVDKSKIVKDTKSKKVEVIDLKLDDDVEKYLSKPNFYPAYHMNKKHWITIILDEALKDESIEKLIDISYKNSEGNSKVAEYNKKVFEYLTKIPKGKVVTYKQVAEYLGNPKLARIVGNILHKNPDGDKYPCFKVVNSHGGLTDAFAFNGKDEQKRRLEKDGVKVENYKVDLKKYQWK